MKKSRSLIKRFAFTKIFALVLSVILFFDSYHFKAEATSLAACGTATNAAICAEIAKLSISTAGAGAKTAQVVNTTIGLTGLAGGLAYWYDQNRGKFGWGGLSENKAKQIQDDVISSPFIQNFPQGNVVGAIYSVQGKYNFKYPGDIQWRTTGTFGGSNVVGPVNPQIIDNGTRQARIINAGWFGVNPWYDTTIEITEVIITRNDNI